MIQIKRPLHGDELDIGLYYPNWVLRVMLEGHRDPITNEIIITATLLDIENDSLCSSLEIETKSGCFILENNQAFDYLNYFNNMI